MFITVDSRVAFGLMQQAAATRPDKCPGAGGGRPGSLEQLWSVAEQVLGYDRTSKTFPSKKLNRMLRKVDPVTDITSVEMNGVGLRIHFTVQRPAQQCFEVWRTASVC